MNFSKFSRCCSSPRISEMTATIYTRAVEIEKFLLEHNVPLASFNIDSPLAVYLPETLSIAREEILDVMDQLHALLLGSLP